MLRVIVLLLLSVVAYQEGHGSSQPSSSSIATDDDYDVPDPDNPWRVANSDKGCQALVAIFSHRHEYLFLSRNRANLRTKVSVRSKNATFCTAEEREAEICDVTFECDVRDDYSRIPAHILRRHLGTQKWRQICRRQDGTRTYPFVQDVPLIYPSTSSVTLDSPTRRIGRCSDKLYMRNREVTLEETLFALNYVATEPPVVEEDGLTLSDSDSDMRCLDWGIGSRSADPR